MKKCNENLIHALKYVEELIHIADTGDFYRDDDGCGIVYGRIRDSAYKIKQLTEAEIENHKRRGKWDTEIC